MGYEWKRNRAGELVRVPRDRGQRPVTLEAGQVRGSSWRVNYRPQRGRAVGFEDGRHQAATGTGRRTPARTPSLSR